MKQQNETWQSVVDGFKLDDDLLNSEPDFSQKLAELEKLKAQELKKFERGNKHAIEEFDSNFDQVGLSEKKLNQLYDRTRQTIKDLLRKAANKCAQNQAPDQHISAQVDQIKNDLAQNIKKRKTLQTMSELLLKKNAELYLKHETMLDEERKLRMDLGSEFQKKMAAIQDELNSEKEERAK